MFGMANLFPDDTGLTVIVHVYKNIDSKARHGPRVKAFPGHPREGDATTIRALVTGQKLSGRLRSRLQLCER